MGKLGTNQGCRQPIRAGQLRIPTPRSLRKPMSPSPGLLHPSTPMKGIRDHPCAHTALIWLQKSYIRGICIFLGEDSQTEIPILVGFEGRGHDDIFSGRELEPVQHFSEVDEGVRFFSCFVGQEKVFAQMNIRLARKLQKSKERRKKTNQPTVCMYLHLQFKNVIDMTIGYVWGKKKREPKENRESGGVHPTTVLLSCGYKQYFADHLNKSLGSCLRFAVGEQVVKTSGKLFHQPFFFKVRWITTHVPLVPRAGATKDCSSALLLRSGCIKAERLLIKAPKNKINIMPYKNIFGASHLPEQTPLRRVL